MAFILNEKYIGKLNSYRLFITNRFLRIYPIYWLTLLITFLLSVSFVVHFEQIHNLLYSLVKNVALFPTLDYLVYLPKIYGGLFVSQSWTLGLELTFYLLAPFFVRKKLRYIMLVFLLSLVLRLYFTHPLRYPYQFSDRFYATAMIFFMLGVLSYKLYSQIKKLKTSNRIIIAVCLFILFLTLFYNYLPLPLRNHGKFLEWQYYIVISLSMPFMFLFSSMMKFDRIIGELSYPIYITHNLVIGLMQRFIFHTWNDINKILTIIVIIVIAILLDKFLVNPIEKYRQARVKTLENKKAQDVTESLQERVVMK
jgi:peptidoglycan/LPS O-acetylase OafA/YrhL